MAIVHRPWATGLARLLSDRRLKKGDLAALAKVRPGTISAVSNSPKAPDIATLQRLANGFTEHDRRANPQAPAVGLWEFFVSDEQAALLRQSQQTQQQLIRQDELIDRAIAKLGPIVASVLQQEISTVSTGSSTPPQAPPVASALEHAPPAASLARGKLHRPRRSKAS